MTLRTVHSWSCWLNYSVLTCCTVKHCGERLHEYNTMHSTAMLCLQVFLPEVHTHRPVHTHMHTHSHWCALIHLTVKLDLRYCLCHHARPASVFGSDHMDPLLPTTLLTTWWVWCKIGTYWHHTCTHACTHTRARTHTHTHTTHSHRTPQHIQTCMKSGHE